MSAIITLQKVGENVTRVKVKTFCGQERVQNFNLPYQRLFDYWTGRDRRAIQQAFPELNNSEREFLLTGMTDKEFDAATKEE